MTTLCYSDALTAYIQQIGRAGRSGIEAEGILYFNNSDIGNPSVKKTMKEYCRNVTECRRKVLKRYFGCDDETVLNNCQPELLVLWKFKEVPTSVQKAAIREKLVNHLSESNCVIDPHVIERIVNEAHLFIQPDSLVTDFGMNVELSEQIAHI